MLKFKISLLITLLLSSHAYAACEAEVERSANVTAEHARTAGGPPQDRDPNKWKESFASEAKYYGSITGDGLSGHIRAQENNAEQARRDNTTLGMSRYNAALARLCLLRAASSGNRSPYVNSSGERQNDPSSEQDQLAKRARLSAQQGQARVDQMRQSGRKTHNPGATAHQCVNLDNDARLFGGFVNSCSYPVSFYSCNYRPKTISGGFNWSADFDCEKQQFGLYDLAPGGKVAAHNHNTEMVYWFACRSPSSPADIEYSGGRARGRCS